MRCADFLQIYSDYRDGLLADDGLAFAAEHHLRECPRCARHDLAVRRGVNLLRTEPEIEPSPGFRRTLDRRLRAGPLESWPATGRLAASVLLAAGVALLVFEGVTLVPPAQEAPSPRAHVVANPGPPFVGFASAELPLAAPATPTDVEEADSAARAAAVAP
jgi:hypothetical protein